jgi:hypothetical protein
MEFFKGMLVGAGIIGILDIYALAYVWRTTWDRGYHRGWITGFHGGWKMDFRGLRPTAPKTSTKAEN